MFAIGHRAVAPVVRGAHNFPDWRGLASPIEMTVWLLDVRGPTNRREWLANRSERLESQDWGAGPAQALSIKVKAWGAGLA